MATILVENLPAVSVPLTAGTGFVVQTTDTMLATIAQVATGIVAQINLGNAGSLTYSSFTGTLNASSIGSVNATSIIGTLNSAQIGSINATSIIGSLTSTQIGSVSVGALVGQLSATQIGAVSVSVLVGPIQASQIGSVSVGTLVGTLAASQIAAVNASSITGQIQATQIGGINASAIIGSISATSIGTISATSIGGTLNATQIGSVAASSINGAIIATQITSLQASQVTGTIVTSQLAGQIINTLGLIGNNLNVIQSVASLPGLPNTSYPNGSIVLLTSTKVLWQNLAGSWTATTASSVLTGTLTASDIASITASQINGPIIAAQIGGINASVINGTITASQSISIAANLLTGTIGANQISIDGSNIVGTITATTITSISSTQIVGQLTATQIGSVSATTISVVGGAITATMIQSITASQISVSGGGIVASQIGSINVTTIGSGTMPTNVAITSGSIRSIDFGSTTFTGTIAASNIGTISAASITGVNASAINGTISANNIGTLNATSIGSVNATSITTGSLNANISVGTGFIQAGAGQSLFTVNSGGVNFGPSSGINVAFDSAGPGGYNGFTFYNSTTVFGKIGYNGGTLLFQDSGSSTTLAAISIVGKALLGATTATSLVVSTGNLTIQQAGLIFNGNGTGTISTYNNNILQMSCPVSFSSSLVIGSMGNAGGQPLQVTSPLTVTSGNLSVNAGNVLISGNYTFGSDTTTYTSLGSAGHLWFTAGSTLAQTLSSSLASYKIPVEIQAYGLAIDGAFSRRSSNGWTPPLYDGSNNISFQWNSGHVYVMVGTTNVGYMTLN